MQNEIKKFVYIFLFGFAYLHFDRYLNSLLFFAVRRWVNDNTYNNFIRVLLQVWIVKCGVFFCFHRKNEIALSYTGTSIIFRMKRARDRFGAVFFALKNWIWIVFIWTSYFSLLECKIFLTDYQNIVDFIDVFVRKKYSTEYANSFMFLALFSGIDNFNFQWRKSFWHSIYTHNGSYQWHFGE